MGLISTFLPPCWGAPHPMLGGTNPRLMSLYMNVALGYHSVLIARRSPLRLKASDPAHHALICSQTFRFMSVRVS